MSGTQWKQEGIDITDTDAAVQAEVDAAQVDITALQADVTTAQADISTAQSDITSLQGDMTAAQADILAAQGDITNLQATAAVKSSKIEFTAEGGLAIWLTNKTGAPSIKGYLVTPYDDSAIDNGFELTAVDAPDIIGVVYDAGIADGQPCRVVINGIADVYFAGNTTRGHFARMSVTADTGDGPGIAMSETKPSSPFATDKHFQEIGHVLESRTGAGLAKVCLHFN